MEVTEDTTVPSGSNLEHARLALEKWRIEEDIKIRREELEIKRKDSLKSVWSSPLIIAGIGLFATILVSVVQTYFQGEANRKLERQRFESALIQKAVETESSEEAAKRLQLLLNLGFITDQNDKIAKYVSKPETIPLQPPNIAGSNPGSVPCPENLSSIADCPDTGCGPNVDAELNQLKNQTALPAGVEIKALTLGELRNLQQPPRRPGDRSTLKELGEGTPIVVMGFLQRVKRTGAESCNCNLTAPADTDLHLVLTSEPTDAEVLSVTAEITPRVRAKGHPNYIFGKLLPLQGKFIKLTGFLLLDTAHIDRPMLRATNWEIHPVMKLEVCAESRVTCESGKGWSELRDTQINAENKTQTPRYSGP